MSRRRRGRLTGTDRLGWCLTHEHAACPGQVYLSMQRTNYNCGCECHGKDGK